MIWMLLLVRRQHVPLRTPRIKLPAERLSLAHDAFGQKRIGWIQPRDGSREIPVISRKHSRHPLFVGRLTFHVNGHAAIAKAILAQTSAVSMFTVMRF